MEAQMGPVLNTFLGVRWCDSILPLKTQCHNRENNDTRGIILEITLVKLEV